MEPIFAYSDYRAFLKDHYLERKAKSASYSYRYFAKKAQLDSPNYYKLVMDGQRNLSHKTIRKFIKGLSLTEKESHYFENLVFLNQAKTDDEKAFFEKNLDILRKDEARAFLTKDQYEVMSKWYPLAIKEILLLKNQKHTPKQIAARLDYQITPEDAKAALQLLERLGLIKKNAKTGKFEGTSQSLQTPDHVNSDVAIRYFSEVFDLASEALEKQNDKERCFSGLTVALNQKDLPKAFKLLHEFRNKMDSFFGKNSQLDAVYQFNLQLFRLDQG